MRKALVLACAAWLAVAPGCGTIFMLGSDREVEVITNPPGAALAVDSIPAGASSPGVVRLDPAREHRIDAQLEDMRGGTQIKRSTRTGIVILDIVFTLGLGLWIDWLTGAMYHFPDSVVVNLGRSYPREEPPLAAQYPPPPALMPHDDPIAPARPRAPAPAPKGAVTQGGESRTVDLRRADAASCEICGEAIARGEPCPQCGQPAEGGGEASGTRDLLAPPR